MERLTFEGNFCDIAMCRENPCPYDGSCTQREVWERLKAYEDAEEQRRLVVLPCKAGDTVWYLRKWCNCDSGNPCSNCKDKVMEIKETVILYFISYGNGEVWLHFFEADVNAKNIGKTVFLTREEAEAALSKEV